ncbi:MAG: dolichol kinase [Candidatus Kapabacteria bacterium]|jgi:dolichol kinase|nr:dolichol kinase [Candidatus Kapabacteria bacterium]
MPDKNEISYTQELLRKTIHILSLSIPIFYYFYDKRLLLKILIPVTLFIIIMDVASKQIPGIKKFVLRLFGKMLRPHEHKANLLNGASWVMISACIFVLIFPKLIFINAFTVLIISDVAAALVGRRIGMHPFFDKSVEGTAAFIISAIIVVGIIGSVYSQVWTFYVVGIIASIVAGIVEAASHYLKTDDNFSIPASFGAVMWLGAIIAEKHLNDPFM